MMVTEQEEKLLRELADIAARWIDESDFVTYDEETQMWCCAACGTIAKYYQGQRLPKEHSEGCRVKLFLDAVDRWKALRDKPAPADDTST